MTTTPTTAATGGSELLRRIAKLFAPLSKPLAGRRWFRLWAVLEHRGRTTGRAYRIPVVARRTADGFVIPVPFAGAQWLKNVLAAGGATLRWDGRDHLVAEPELIDWAAAAPAFSRLQRAAAPRLGIRRYLRVRMVAPG